MTYPPPEEVEGPEEVDPAYLADGVRAELLLKNPGSAMIEPDGTRTELVPEPRWLEWSGVPLVADPANCGHGYSVCATCADQWGSDYYMRLYSGEQVVWISPDHPDAPDADAGSPPIWNL